MVGCGGDCGPNTCSSNQKCSQRNCNTVSGCTEWKCDQDLEACPVCGDNQCTGPENASNCLQDCCRCTPWTNLGCADDCMESERTCTPAGCQDEYRCRFMATCRPCFTGGVPVLTPSGQRPIRDLKAGDEVVSLNPATGARVTARVSRIHVRQVQEYLRVSLEDGRVLQVTENHPFFDPRQGTYRKIGLFRPGERLHQPLAQPQTATIGSIERIPEKTTVYNLTVDGDFQNFIVEGILVHNKMPQPF